MLQADDWGLNEWLAEYDAHMFCIYAPDLRTYCVVDEIDYQFCLEYRWCLKTSRGISYFRRAVSSWHCGVRGPNTTVYLHVEIMRRTGIAPPCEGYTLVDHRDGDTFNNRRKNLRWSNHSLNAKNIGGKIPYDEIV
jgi:hypothetical protein